MVDVASLVLAVDSTQVRSAGRDLDGFASQSRKAESAAASMSKMLKRAFGGVAVVATIHAAIQTHKDFTRSISELSAITGAAGKDLQFYKEQAREIGATTTLSATQAAEAFKLIASAKPELLKSKEALAAVTKETVALAEAAVMTMPDAARALAGSLNQFSEGADQASRYINVLAAGAKYGSSEIIQTAAAMDKAGSVAAKLKISFEETNVAIQAMAAMNIKGEIAGTGLRSTLIKLATQSRDEFNPEIVGLTTAFQNLAKANLSTAELTKLVGLESITAANAIILQADSLDELKKNITGTNIAYEQQAINTDNLTGDTKALLSVLSDLAIGIGEKLDPFLRSVTKSLTEFFAAISNNMDTIAMLVKIIGSIIGLQLVGWLVAVTAKAIGTAAAFYGLASAMGAATAAAGLLKVAFIALGGIPGLIAALVIGAGIAATEIFKMGKAAGDAKADIAHFTGEIEGLNEAALRLASSEIGKEMEQLAAKIKSLSNANIADAQKIEQLKALGIQYGILSGKLEDVNAELLKMATVGMGGAPNVVGETVAASNDLVKSLQKQFDTLGMTEEQLLKYNIALELAKSENSGVAKEVNKLVAQINAKSKALKLQEMQQKNLDKELDKAIAQEEELNQLYKRNRLADAELLRSLRDELSLLGLTNKEKSVQIALRRLSKDATDAERKAVRDLAEQLYEEQAAIEQAEKNAGVYQQAWNRAIERIDDAFVDLWESAFKGARDFMDTLKNTFKRFLAEMAHAALTRPIMVQFSTMMGAGGMSTATQAATQAGGGNIPGVPGISQFAQMGGGYVGAFMGAGAGALYGYEKGGVSGAAVGGLVGYAGGAALTTGASALAAGWGGAASMGAGLAGASSALAAIPGWGWAALAALAVFGSGKAKPSNKAAWGTVDVGSGETFDVGSQTGKKFSQATNDARDNFMQVVQAFSQGLKEATGGTLTGTVRAQIGERDGTQVWGSMIGAQRNFSNPTDALQSVLDTMLKNIQGIDSQFRAVFNRIDLTNLEKAIADINSAGYIINKQYVEPLQSISTHPAVVEVDTLNKSFRDLEAEARRLGLSVQPIRDELTARTTRRRDTFNNQISDAILAITDPMAFALKEFDAMAADRMIYAKVYGGNLVEVERLTAMERARIIEQYAADSTDVLDQELERQQQALERQRDRAFDSIGSYLGGLAFSKASPLSAEAQLEEARKQYEQTKSLVAAGDVNALADAVRVSQQFLEELQSYTGGGADYAMGFRDVNQFLGGVIATRDTPDDSVVVQLRSNGEAAMAANAQLVDEMRAIRNALNAQIAVSQDLMDRVLLLQAGS